MSLSEVYLRGWSAPAVSSVVGALLLIGCGSGTAHGGIAVVDPAAGAAPGESAAVYLTIENSGPDDALVGAGCDCSERVSLHVTEERDDLHMMVETDRIDIASGETTVLGPGGSHLMLEGLDAPLEAGTGIEVTLEFEHGGERTVEVPVVPLDELAERVDR